MLTLPPEPDWNAIAKHLATAAAEVMIASLLAGPRQAYYKSDRSACLLNEGWGNQLNELSQTLIHHVQYRLPSHLAYYRQMLADLQAQYAEQPSPAPPAAGPSPAP